MAIPPVNVEDVNIRRLQILETRINGKVHRFHGISLEDCFLLDRVIASPKIGGILASMNINQVSASELQKGKLTFVATIIWSRLPRASIQSPMNSSDDPS